MPLPTVKSIYVGLMFSYLFFMLEKAQAADGGSYGPPCMQLFLRGCGLCDYRIFSKTPPAPLNLKMGSTAFP